MLSLSTINRPLDLLRCEEPEFVTLDIETMDSKQLGLWDQPIVSYAISFPRGSLKQFRCPTFAVIIENLGEERQLLSNLLPMLRECEKMGTTVCGHNVNYLHRYVPTVAPWKTGFDLPKLMKRAAMNRLDYGFVPNLKSFDTMDLGVKYYRCDEEFPNATTNRILGLQRIEADFNIRRPKGQEKLGSLVREFFQEYQTTGDRERLRDIILYNCVDTIAESIVTHIFMHCTRECRPCQGLVSPNTKCPHIPNAFEIEQMPEWDVLAASRLMEV